MSFNMLSEDVSKVSNWQKIKPLYVMTNDKKIVQVVATARDNRKEHVNVIHYAGYIIYDKLPLEPQMYNNFVTLESTKVTILDGEGLAMVKLLYNEKL